MRNTKKVERYEVVESTEEIQERIDVLDDLSVDYHIVRNEDAEGVIETLEYEVHHPSGTVVFVVENDGAMQEAAEAADADFAASTGRFW